MSQMLAPAEELTEYLPVVRRVELVEVAALRPGVTLRLGAINRDHLESVILAAGQWPPIVIRRSGNAIVDGHYRYLAAQHLGLRTLECIYFDGEADSAYVEALRCNRSHGLPLSLSERTGAARRVLDMYPEWSDRRIGATCGLAPGTVGRLRASPPASGTGAVQTEFCVGRDGRSRPRDPKASRERIVHALQSRPDGSLREIARLTGASPATVRAVKARMGSSPEPPYRELPFVLPIAPAPRAWSADTALAAAVEGARFLEWFDRTAVGDEWRSFLQGIPVSRIYEIADEARRRAAVWQDFAGLLEDRIRGHRRPVCA